LSEINPAYSGPPIQHAELPPVVSGTQKAHDAMTDANNVQTAEVVEETEEAPQTADTASDSPPATAKAKDTLWLNWCESMNIVGVVDTVWSEKQLVIYAKEQGIEFGKMTQQECEELVLFMAEDTKAVEAWIEDAI
jgi:hypothetical protein